MKIAFFTNAYRPTVSGVVNSVDVMRKGLMSAKHTPFIFAPETPGYREEHAGVWRFPSMNLLRKVEFPLAIPYSKRLFALIPRLSLDIIHVHHPFLLGDVGSYFAKQLKLPLVYTFHTQLEQYAHYVPLPQELVRWAARERVASFANNCDCVICPSPSIRNLLDEYGLNCRIETLQNAIDIKAFSKCRDRALRKSLGVTPECVLAIFTGRLSPEKNLTFLLQACQEVHKRHPELRLLLLGDGPSKENLQEQATQLGLANVVLFPGKVAYHLIPSYYAAADLFVMTSTTEVKPLAVLEAMASGLPVIAVDACGTGDTVTHEHDGLLCRCNLADYVHILERAVSDSSLRQTLGSEAKCTAQSYSIENYISKLTSIYEQLIQQYGK